MVSVSRLALTLAVASLAFGFTADATQKKNKKKAAAPAPAASSSVVASIPFGASKGGEPINASGIVPLGDSRFLVCDNRSRDALVEISLDSEGKLQGAPKRRPLTGVDPAAAADLEGLTSAEDGGKRVVFAVSSLSVKIDKKSGGTTSSTGSLLRIVEGTDSSLRAEAVSGFREWLLSNVPKLGKAAAMAADSGGLNVEGLAWDQARGALLLGLRTPTAPSGAWIVPIRVKSLSGPWTTANLEVLSHVGLVFEKADAAQGVRGFEFDSRTGQFLIVVGKAVSKTEAPYQLYAWDGNAEGRTRKLGAMTFDPGAKFESVATGTIGGRDAVVFADDGGGYAFVWADDSRLAVSK